MEKINKGLSQAQGSDFLVSGGLAIMRNPFHDPTIQNTNYADHIIDGFDKNLVIWSNQFNLDDLADNAWGSHDILFMIPEMLNTLKFLNVKNIKTDLFVGRKNMLVLKRSEIKIQPDEYYEEYDSTDDDLGSHNQSQGPFFDEEEG